MRDEHDAHAEVGEGRQDLTGDRGPLALVGGGQRLVAEQQRAGPQPVDGGAQARRLLVQPAAGQGEQEAADVSGRARDRLGDAGDDAVLEGQPGEQGLGAREVAVVGLGPQGRAEAGEAGGAEGGMIGDRRGSGRALVQCAR
ncbi:hypothetical protein [Actinomadura parmotrematis]|uniref:Uncharacterized protein n=1 Tax=Actinomadura parmotrematis TaxID=2864039 RepID=A0ABS7G448_9ACTN|nr:hypothetical protein [Actinomadura parmotrematis]MBW8487492.1 hypothetical protein [Actinomadura parmotrematis]